MRTIGLVIVGLLVLLAAACSDDGPKTEDKTSGLEKPSTGAAGQKVNVVATTTQAVDFTRVVGGDRVTLIGLIKPGVDPHEFEPTPQDAQAVSQANLIVINGVGLESFLDKLLAQAGKGKPVVDLSKGIKIRKGADEEEKAGDPHIWFSPLNVKVMVDNLAGAFAKVDPAGASVYRANADAYKQQLDALDGSIRTQIDAIPKDRRKMVTNHDAFGYYIDRYGLTFIGSVILSLDTNAELTQDNASVRASRFGLCSLTLCRRLVV